MKVLVVLVLALFTGCNASFFQADAPKSQLELVQDSFWSYVGEATKTADDAINTIRKSPFGQDITARLTEAYEVGNVYASSLNDQLPPGTQDMMTKVATEAEVLKRRVTKELDSVRDRVMPQVEVVATELGKKLEQFQQELMTFADSRGLTATVVTRFEEMKANVEQTGKDLQVHLEPLTDEVRNKVNQHLEDFKQSVAPLAQTVQTEVTQKITEVKDMASPYVEEVREKLDPLATDLQVRLLALYESFTRPQ